MWYGINQYLPVTEELAAGLRFEWFATSTDAGAAFATATLPLGVSGDFYAITFGRTTRRWRTSGLAEVRWDFFDPIGGACRVL